MDTLAGPATRILQPNNGHLSQIQGFLFQAVSWKTKGSAEDQNQLYNLLQETAKLLTGSTSPQSLVTVLDMLRLLLDFWPRVTRPFKEDTLRTIFSKARQLGHKDHLFFASFIPKDDLKKLQVPSIQNKLEPPSLLNSFLTLGGCWPCERDPDHKALIRYVLFLPLNFFQMVLHFALGSFSGACHQLTHS